MKTSLGPDYPMALETMNNLARVLENQGKYEEAEKIYKQTLAQMEKVLGPNHSHTLVSINNLALVWKGQASVKKQRRYIDRY
jgi:tetratricopeptide (TPR) repeat protein